MDQRDWKCRKDAVEKHVIGKPYLLAVKILKRSELGTVVYRDSVIMNLPLEKSFLRLNPADKDSLRAKFNTTYYVLKKERPFTDCPDLFNLQTKNGISRHANIEQIKIRRNYVSDLVNLVSPWSTPMVGKKVNNLKICHSRLQVNTFASTKTVKNVP